MKLVVLKRVSLIFINFLILLFSFGCGNYQLPDQKTKNWLYSDPYNLKAGKTGLKPKGNNLLVVQGDSLYKISKRENISLRSLIIENQIKAPYIIYPGQKLRVPKQTTYTVKRGENIYGIARTLKINSGLLVRKNNLQPPYLLKAGQKLLIPLEPNIVNKKADNKTRKVTLLTSTPNITPNTAKAKNLNLWNKAFKRNLHGRYNGLSAKFLWPIRGRILIGFGPRKGGLHNDGINIAAPRGTKIRAAENGIVVYSGNQLRGFGNLALIRHKNGWMTAYAHASSLNIKRGDTVQRGEVIGQVGRTGSVAKPQLHFELRKNNKPKDPRKYLTLKLSLLRLFKGIDTFLSSNLLYKLPGHSS